MAQIWGTCKLVNCASQPSHPGGDGEAVPRSSSPNPSAILSEAPEFQISKVEKAQISFNLFTGIYRYLQGQTSYKFNPAPQREPHP